MFAVITTGVVAATEEVVMVKFTLLDPAGTVTDAGTCATPGFALESFDVLGGWRDHYRALGDGKTANNATTRPTTRTATTAPAPVIGIGKNGQRFVFHEGPAVDASGQLPDGRKFADVRGLKRLLLSDERQVARNLTRQLIVYATGAPVRFGDRAKVEQILDAAAPSGYGVRTLIHEIVKSELFVNK